MQIDYVSNVVESKMCKYLQYLFNILHIYIHSGNEMTHQLTSSAVYRVAFVLTDKDDAVKHAVYNTFTVGPESEPYRLQIGGYDGTISTAGVYTA